MRADSSAACAQSRNQPAGSTAPGGNDQGSIIGIVATELGLMVAIPTLVAHGFLAQRIQRNLSRLERYALEFCTAVETAKSSQDAADSGGSRPA